MVHPSGKVVVAGNLGRRKEERSEVAVLAGIRQGIERCEKGRHRLVDARYRVRIERGTWAFDERERLSAHNSILRGRRPTGRDPAGRTRGDLLRNARAKRLAQPFVISKDESLVLPDRASAGHPELIAPEGGNGGPVEKVPRIDGAVAQKFVGAAMKRVGSRPRDGGDDPAG